MTGVRKGGHIPLAKSGGKGDVRRQPAISAEQYSDNWDRIFGKKETIKEDKPDEKGTEQS